jgi:hypothetical protein
LKNTGVIMQSIRLSAAAALSLLAAGCALTPPAPPDEPAFVVLGENGRASARLVTQAVSCPDIELDGRAVPMAVRVQHGPIPLRSNAAAKLAQAPAGAALTCEYALPPGLKRASVRGQALALPREQPRRIVVIGDTGCRLKGTWQECNDPERFPFAQVAAAAANWRPDLVVHVGDYQYREEPCPADRPGCAGSPWGYGWDTWRADLFAPGAALLRAAPWVMARGNHESCSRAGQGYWRYLDPRPFHPGQSCDRPLEDAVGDHSDPYAVPLGDGAQLIVLDSSNTHWRGLPKLDPRRARFADSWRKLSKLAEGARHNIAVFHHPILGIGADQDRPSGPVTLFGGDKGLLDAFGDMDPRFMPASVQMVLSGHVHVWEQVSFASPHPSQFVAGFSGTAEDTAPLPATVPELAPAPGAVVEQFSSWVDGFGFMTMERLGPDRWEIGVWDREGKRRNRCQAEGRKSWCEVAQVR